MRRFVLRSLLCAGLLAGATVRSPAQSGDQLCASAGRKAGCLKPAARPELCPPDWEKSRRGGCLAETDAFGPRQRAYVHPAGWVVDRRCLEGGRVSRAELLQALTAAQRRMDPSVPVSAGGCLSEYNPLWGRELSDDIWSRRMHVACPPSDKDSATCAAHGERGGINMITLANVARCMGPDTTSLAGILFHEALHAAGADNYSTEEHNRAWDMEQYVFVSDRVYGAEATCFWGTDPRLRRRVNILQCKKTVSYDVMEPRAGLCDGFNTSFTDVPAGFIKH